MDHQPIGKLTEDAARQVVDAGLKVHRLLGPGLLENVYEHCLAHELDKRNIAIQRQVALPILFDGEAIDAAYRTDLIVADCVIVEIKSVDVLAPRGPIAHFPETVRAPVGPAVEFQCRAV